MRPAAAFFILACLAIGGAAAAVARSSGNVTPSVLVGCSVATVCAVCSSSILAGPFHRLDAPVGDPWCVWQRTLTGGLGDGGRTEFWLPLYFCRVAE